MKRKTFCRVCQAFCGLVVEIEGDRVTTVGGDFEHPMSRGHSCEKGRRVGDQLHDPERLCACLERRPDGSFAEIASAQALDAVAERLRGIIDRYGPRAVATYSGTAAYLNGASIGAVRAFHEAIGSSMRFSSLSIDQPAKVIAIMRHGVWGGGGHSFASADVLMLIGTNPLVSAFHVHGGLPGFRPQLLSEAQRERGLCVIVVDPRRSETARLADLHLQVRPGEDPTLLAGMVRVILEENLHDRAFCEAHAVGVEVLREAVDGFGLDYVARRSGVPAARVEEAARLFARGPRGVATGGTGPCMAPHPNLSEHLILCLDTLCGRWSREGERVNAPSVLTPNLPRPAQALPSNLLPPEINIDANQERSRIRNLRQMSQEMPTAALADEILTPGEGQVRALIVCGGNPIAAWPDQARTLRALDSLELLVCLDIKPTATCQRADYVFASTHMLERSDVAHYQDMLYEEPFAQFSDALLAPRGDSLDDWFVFAALAERLGKRLKLPGGELRLEDEPGTLEVLELLYPAAKVSIQELARYEGGHIFDEIDVRVAPPIPGIEGRLQLAPDGIPEELRAVLAEPLPSVGRYGRDGGFSHLLIPRRMKHVNNSLGQGLPHNRERINPAFVHPDELVELGVMAGELVQIESEDGCVTAVIDGDEGLLPGVVSMAHCFGGDPATSPDPREVGTSVTALISVEHDCDPWVGMPRQSAIPVRLRAVG